MGKDSGIQWTTHTFNPWWGCTKISAGCKHCYADAFSQRPIHDLGGGRKGALAVWGDDAGRRLFGDGHWHDPKRWNLAAERKGARAQVFCASMADVCEDRPDLIQPRGRLARLILSTLWLDWLLLTKRPHNFVPLFGPYFGERWPSNVWAGCTVENQEEAERRVPHLIRVPASVLFLSCEPLIGPVDLTFAVENPRPIAYAGERMPALAGLSWVIVGGESGTGARQFVLPWARSLREQCHTSGTYFFMKQYGAHPVERFGGPRIMLRDSHGGDPDEWPETWPREFPVTR